MSDRGLKQTEPVSDAARLLLAGARERFSTAAADLHLSERSRLTEWQRLTASGLLSRLVRSIEDSLRVRIARHFSGEDALSAALGSIRVEIALPMLERAEVLRDPDLGTVLVRRVEEHRFWKENATLAGEDYLTQLVRDPDPALAGEAMILLIARSRRFDRFQEPVMGQGDLPADLQHRLVWMIAAALRQYIVQQHGVASGMADAVITAAAAEVLASYDEGRNLEASCTRLARRLLALGRLEGRDIARMLEEGQLTLFVAALGVRCALDYGATWEVLCDPRGLGAAVLLKSGAVDRESAAWILLLLNSRGRLFSGQEGDAAAEQHDIFNSMPEEAAAAILQLWRADPGYRAAIARLSTRNRGGQGPG